MKSIHFLYAAATSLLILSILAYPVQSCFLLPLFLLPPLFYKTSSRLKTTISPSEGLNFSLMKSEAMRKLLPFKAHRHSTIAEECRIKINTLRTMAELVRKPSLRKRYLEACEMCDVVTETIRRMPEDSATARHFFTKGLAEIEDSLTAHFALHRSKEYKKIEKIDRSLLCDVKLCEQLLLRLRRYQERILEEGR